MLASGLDAILKRAISSPMYHILSPTTLDVMCLLMSETTLSHPSMPSPPLSFPASWKECPWKVNKPHMRRKKVAWIVPETKHMLWSKAPLFSYKNQLREDALWLTTGGKIICFTNPPLQCAWCTFFFFFFVLTRTFTHCHHSYTPSPRFLSFSAECQSVCWKDQIPFWCCTRSQVEEEERQAW